MCGIAGILSINPVRVGTDRLLKMTRSLAHRGPDGDGHWISPGGYCGLGHRRLAVIDLSEKGAQPMHYMQRYAIIHNGEIYNYLELKESLHQRGYVFQSGSDTEVIVAAFDHYREECLSRLEGMFAFAIWDEKEQMLFCARDRFGEKPLYYAMDDTELLIGSEKKALWAAGIPRQVNNPLLLNFLVTGHTETAADNTISFYQDIFSLPPSHYMKIQVPTLSFELHRYWDGDKEKQIPISEAEAAEELYSLLHNSVQKRLRSDVAVGTSLSGGLDSSSIVTLMASGKKDPDFKTFSAVFPGFERDESNYIELVCSSLKLPNYRVEPTSEGFIKDFEKLCYHQEEPFGSSSIYAQYKVFEMAKQEGVTVLLDGQGADELLGGYSRYIPWHLQHILKAHPGKFLGEWRAFKRQPVEFQWGWKNYLAAFFPLQVPSALEKRELKKIKQQPDIEEAFRNSYLDKPSIHKPLVTKLNDILYFDCFQFGLETLLRFADRNSMAHGRELRLPFLDHHVTDFIFSLPAHFKMREGWTKWILRKAMERQLPSEITWRKDKVAYEPPQKKWMNDKIMQDYLREAKQKLVDGRILNPSVLTKKNQPLDAYRADNYDWRYLVAAAFL